MAAASEPLVVWINGAFGVGKTALPTVLVDLPRGGYALVRELVEDTWAERAPRKLVEAYRAAGDESR